MKISNERSISGPMIALGTTLVTVIVGLLGFYALSPAGVLDLSSAPAQTPQTATPTVEPTATPTPDISPQTIQLSAADGTQLKATLYPSRNPAEPQPALLLLHMAYSNRRTWHNFAQQAQAAGYVVLALDLRGHGESDGEKQFEPVMDGDVDTALAWLRNRPETDASKIAIFGASVGANLALRAATRHPEIKSIALLSPGLSLWQLGADGAMTLYGERPVLFAVSEEDKYPAASSAKLAEEAQGKHEMLVFPGADHGTDMLKSQDDLQPMLLDWLRETLPAAGVANNTPSSGPVIGSATITTSRNAGSASPRLYKKIELTFDVETVAQNLQWPYDSAPPAGIEPERGITVDGLFTPDNWQTVYTQPAFYYQDFEHEVKGDRDWIYPTDQFAWKVRFAPTQTGEWQFKLAAQDASGTTETAPQSFVVEDSDSKGFVRVSQTDPRYFEFDDGTYFAGLGYNLNYRRIDWVNPFQANQSHIETLGQNGIELIRIWLSQWEIFGDSGPWRNYVGWSPLFFDETTPESEVSLKLIGSWNKCVVYGWESPEIPLKRNTSYRIKVRYKIANLGPPVDSEKPYGLVAKTGGWLWGGDSNCDNPDTGTRLTSHQHHVSSDWQILEDTFESGNRNFLDLFHLALENVDQGTAYIDNVSIQEVLENNEFGPNVVAKPDFDVHQYFEQRNSFAFDRVLELARRHDIYFKVTLLEKETKLFKQLDYEGNFFSDNDLCWDDVHSNDPTLCPDSKWFYGDWRKMTKGRWLQQAFWRYVQARWGYSTNIHSWELLNEGDPFNSRHYALADEFGKFMHCKVFGVTENSRDGEKCTYQHPNAHMVTTSFWHSYPRDKFWANSSYSNLDYADIHKYFDEGDESWLRVDDEYVPDVTAQDFYDTAAFTNRLSQLVGARQLHGAGKPIMRGETGLIFNNHDWFAENGDGGVWLHNYIWGGINSGGLIESYWASPPTHNHISSESSTTDHDHRWMFKPYRNFIDNIPLTNGHYQEAAALTSDENNLRVWGQKDVVNGCAHLWIQNKGHTWKNVVDEVNVEPVSGTVSISGFQPGKTYTLTWWDTYQPDSSQQILKTDTVVPQEDGTIIIPVDDLITDVALKIVSTTGCDSK